MCVDPACVLIIELIFQFLGFVDKCDAVVQTDEDVAVHVDNTPLPRDRWFVLPLTGQRNGSASNVVESIYNESVLARVEPRELQNTGSCFDLESAISLVPDNFVPLNNNSQGTIVLRQSPITHILKVTNASDSDAWWDGFTTAVYQVASLASVVFPHLKVPKKSSSLLTTPFSIVAMPEYTPLNQMHGKDIAIGWTPIPDIRPRVRVFNYIDNKTGKTIDQRSGYNRVESEKFVPTLVFAQLVSFYTYDIEFSQTTKQLSQLLVAPLIVYGVIRQCAFNLDAVLNRGYSLIDNLATAYGLSDYDTLSIMPGTYMFAVMYLMFEGRMRFPFMRALN
jgi:hypothetical protein